ncbi:4a-hydroxytetrahydrobiopterin dehydratase [Brevibacterium aurantiacum]|uniref:4a-hydroxytetrahydrobiopterin dehydratase n=1 Tax=Brevibacterium aurantiacum TaxID=273384 RepID=UPI0018678BB1|nr:4a-hydroxytetrahydrobiopterin dehydratase [Brevibacterium aurantiacum]
MRIPRLRAALWTSTRGDSASVADGAKHNCEAQEEWNVGNNEVLTSSQIFDAGIEEWRQLAGPIRARFPTDDFTQGLVFVNAIGEAAQKANHSPDIALTSTGVTVTLSSHGVGGVIDDDIALARKISELAAEAGLAADTASLMQASSLSTRAQGIGQFPSMRRFSAVNQQVCTREATSSTPLVR